MTTAAEAPIHYILSEYDSWQADRGTEWDRNAFVLDLAPDYLHKAEISGGPPYGLLVPNDGIDGLLLGERHQTTFVNYLRICFGWGGFPGWYIGERPDWAMPPPHPPDLITDLAESLLPI